MGAGTKICRWYMHMICQWASNVKQSTVHEPRSAGQWLAFLQTRLFVYQHVTAKAQLEYETYETFIKLPSIGITYQSWGQNRSELQRKYYLTCVY